MKHGVTGHCIPLHRRWESVVALLPDRRGLKLSVPTVTASLKHLPKLGIARKTTRRNYGRIDAYRKYLKILNEGTEPLN